MTEYNNNNKFVPQAQTYEVKYVEVKEPSKISKIASYLGAKTVENCSSCPADSANRNRNFSLKVVLEGRLFGAASLGFLSDSGRTEWFCNTNDASQAADKIIKKKSPWIGMAVTGGNRSRTANAIWSAINRHNAGCDINGETAGSFSDS